MKIDPILGKAAGLAKRKDFDSAIKILKAQEDNYYGSFKYYYLYAVVCLYAGSFVEAHSNFKLARQIKMNDVSVMLGIASLYLKRMDTVQAVDYYLDVQEIEPNNKIAKKALDIIRKHSSSEELSDWLTPARLSKLFPPIPSPVPGAKTFIAGALLLLVILVYGFLAGFHILPNPIKKQDKRVTSDFLLTVQERSESVEKGVFQRYTLTQDQVTNLYDNALSLFTSYRDEAAKTHLNKILESNASETLKNKSRIMMSYMETPGFHNFKRNDNVSITEITREPFLYRDVHVIWYGMATNVIVNDEHTRFDLLVGYDIKRPLEGLVSVVFGVPVAINTERPLEVLGKIILDNSPHGFSLEGVAIHQSGRLEN